MQKGRTYPRMICVRYKCAQTVGYKGRARDLVPADFCSTVVCSTYPSVAEIQIQNTTSFYHKHDFLSRAFWKFQAFWRIEQRQAKRIWFYVIFALRKKKTGGAVPSPTGLSEPNTEADLPVMNIPSATNPSPWPPRYHHRFCDAAWYGQQHAFWSPQSIP